MIRRQRDASRIVLDTLGRGLLAACAVMSASCRHAPTTRSEAARPAETGAVVTEPAPAPAPTPAPTPAPASVPDTLADTRLTSACATLTRANEAVLASAKGDVSAYVPQLAGICAPSGHGAWAFRVTQRKPGEDGRPASLHVWLVHLDAKGTVDAQVDAPTLDTGENEGDNCCEVSGGTVFTVTPLVDYDGDGELELYIGALQEGDEGRHAEKHVIFTARGGAIRPLPAAASLPLEGVEDVDHDGLPDLLLRYFEGESGSDCTGFEYAHFGPDVLGHAHRDGTFSMDDDVALQFARKICPRPPTGDPRKRDVACAVMWHTQGEIVAAIHRERAACAAANPGPFDPCSSTPNPCEDYSVARAFAEAKLAFTLR